MIYNNGETTAEIIKDMCGKAQISQNVLTGIIGRAQRAVSKRFQDDSFTLGELFAISDALNCKLCLTIDCRGNKTTIITADEAYEFIDNLRHTYNAFDIAQFMDISINSFDTKMRQRKLKCKSFITMIESLSAMGYSMQIETKEENMTDRDILYDKYFSTGLSDKAKADKIQRQLDYAKRTDYKDAIKYLKSNRRHYMLVCSIITERDIVERLDRKDNVTGYIKQLIRDDIKRNGGTTK